MGFLLFYVAVKLIFALQGSGCSGPRLPSGVSAIPWAGWRPAKGGISGVMGGGRVRSYCRQSPLAWGTCAGGTGFLMLSRASGLPCSLLRDHRPDAAAEDQVDGAGAGREHHAGAAVVVGHAAGHRPAAGGPPAPPAALPRSPDHPEL